GWRRLSSSAYIQCVVAERPSSSPASASRNAPEHSPAMRAPRRWASRRASTSARGGRSSGIRWAGTTTRSASHSTSRPPPASTDSPPGPVCGPGAGAHVRLAVAGVLGIGVAYGFARYGFGLFLPRLREEFGLSLTLVGAIGSAAYAGYLAALVLAGLLADRVGPRTPILLGACPPRRAPAWWPPPRTPAS